MHLRTILVFLVLVLAGCSASAEIVLDAEQVSQPGEVDSSAPEPTPELAVAAEPSPTAVAPEDQTPEEPEEEPEEEPADDLVPSASTPFDEIAALLAGSDFELDAAEERCVSDGISSRLAEGDARALIAAADRDLEPDDQLTGPVVIVYEELAACMGSERIVTVILEPEFNPEGHACFLAAFPTEEAQLDAIVAVMTVELGGLDEAPGRYQPILAQANAACGNLG